MSNWNTCSEWSRCGIPCRILMNYIRRIFHSQSLLIIPASHVYFAYKLFSHEVSPFPERFGRLFSGHSLSTKTRKTWWEDPQHDAELLFNADFNYFTILSSIHSEKMIATQLMVRTPKPWGKYGKSPWNWALNLLCNIKYILHFSQMMKFGMWLFKHGSWWLMMHLWSCVYRWLNTVMTMDWMKPRKEIVHRCS